MDRGRYRAPGSSSAVPGSSNPDPAELEGFHDRLRLFAARRLHDWAAAEDVAQEAISRALEALRAGRLENPAALPGFLFQTALHVCLRHIRSAGRERRALQRFGGGEGGGAESPLSAILSTERRSNLRKALERLEPDERRLLEMSFRDDLGSEDIGRQLGLTPGAVRVRRHRAIKRLAELLAVTKPGDRELKE